MFEVIKIFLSAIAGLIKIAAIWAITGCLVVFAIWAGASATEAIEKAIRRRK